MLYNYVAHNYLKKELDIKWTGKPFIFEEMLMIC